MLTASLRNKFLVRSTLTLLAVFILLHQVADGQRRRSPRTTTGFDDIVFAISFSPDGRTLAIARGAGEPSQRYARIELWDAETGQIRHVIKGFDGPIGSISFSPDGKTLVSGSSEYHSEKIQEKARSREGLVIGELKWWDAETGELKNKLALPGAGNLSVRATHSPDGKQLALAESFMEFSFLTTYSPFDVANPSMQPLPLAFARSPVLFRSDLRLVDSQTGATRVKLKTSTAHLTVFSPDGALLAVENGGEVKLWNMRTNKEEHKVKGFKGRPNAIAFSPNSRLLAVASTSFERRSEGDFIKIMGRSELRLYDVQTWKPVLHLQDLGAVNSLAFAPGGNLLLGGISDETEGNLPAVKLCDIQTGKLQVLPAGGEDFKEAVDWMVLSHSAGLLAFRSGPAAVRVMDIQTWKLKQTMDAHSAGDADPRPVNRFLLSVNHVAALAFSSDGKTLSGEVEGSGFRQWDTRTGEKKAQRGGKDSAGVVAIAADGDTMAQAGEDATVRLWNSHDDRQQVIPELGAQPISALALSADGRTVAIGSGEEITLWNTAKDEKTWTLSGHSTTINCLAFSVDDRLLASADDAGNIKLWNLANGQLRDAFASGGKVTALSFAPSGQVLATAGEDKTISVWDLRSDGLRLKLKKHEGVVNALAFSPDGQLLASGSDDRTVIVWETASGKARRILKGHDLTVTAVAFSPDGSLIASGSGNASIVLWEVKSGRLNRVLR